MDRPKGRPGRPGDVISIAPADWTLGSGEPLTLRLATVPDIFMAGAWVRVSGVEVLGGFDLEARRVLVRAAALTVSVDDDGVPAIVGST